MSQQFLSMLTLPDDGMRGLLLSPVGISIQAIFIAFSIAVAWGADCLARGRGEKKRLAVAICLSVVYVLATFLSIWSSGGGMFTWGAVGVLVLFLWLPSVAFIIISIFINLFEIGWRGVERWKRG